MDARHATEQSNSDWDSMAVSLTEQELQNIKEELGLTDIDSAANPNLSLPLSTTHVSSYGDRYSTPFDIPLSEEERILLEECTVGTRNHFAANAHATRSPSLAEVADSLIKDLERFDLANQNDSNNNSLYDSSSDIPDLEYEETRGRVDTCPSQNSDISVAASSSNSSALVGVARLEMSGEGIAPMENGAVSDVDMEPHVAASNHNVEPENNNKVESKATPSEVIPNVITTSTPVKPRPPPTIDIVSRSSSSSLDSDSLPASIDSGLPVKDVPVPQHKYFVVVAIDFGTTFSGYAFSFTRDSDSIHMMRKWEGGDPGVSNQKTPTTLLLKPDGTFYSFGFGARDFYHDLEPEESRKWMYFEKFKMALHTQKDLNKSAEIKAANGKSIKAVAVFAHALKFFKDHVIEELTDQSATRILESDIQWVITVPAIWRAPAKQFMRTAAYEAGLASPEVPDQILIALEPEAASIFCRKLRLRDCVWEESKRRSTITSYSENQLADEFEGKTRYMVVDCGGGTVDLTVHELNTNTGTLEELNKGTGGACGATGVDDEFEKLLKAIFGKDFIEQFKAKRPAGWVDLMIAFEAKKRTASPTKTNPLNISLPFAFIDYYKKRGKGSSIESSVKKFGNPNVKWSSQGLLRIAPETMKELFEPVLRKIVAHILDLLSKDSVQNVKYLFLVGGFAESPLLQATIRETFASKMRIIIPHDVGLTILKGAVLFGLDPTVVRVRRATMTYGVGVLNRYVTGKHPRQKLVKKNGIEWCTDIFDKFVIADQPVNLGELVTRSYAPAKPTSKSTTITIYCTEEEEVTFVTDPGVRRCGHLRIEMPDVNGSDPGKPRELQASMEFGDTEIKVTALDVLTGKNANASIDFLSN